ncbi:GDP-mannose 4,6-dehydratase [Undibacterium fentianense]|uniref:GDP-mannose 4,6-dehydratase n=1 Tax=Undibacterium fentianense TaxID=2828728 RepID=A0A941IG67_9BURK|nr:GDP-mannose 4,6-dehydratase [Undibacterium fentianense]MBR7801481.1 GDP-mannose 4,6-dehydratase [Undibacterium fentianense]
MDILSKSKPRRPRALITGLRGFTGEYLANELRARGYDIFGTAYGNEALGLGVYYVDLCDPFALQEVVNQVQPDIVAHLAAISFVGHGNVEDIYRINVVGTRNLLDALTKLSTPPTAVLIASSANIYGNSSAGVIAETELPLPANDYAISKLAVEHVARLWMDRLPIFITRPFNYTGVGQAENFLLPKIVAHFKRKANRIELGNLDVARDFSDVRNVAKAYAELLLKVPAGETFNVCTGKAYTLREVISMAENIAGYKIEVQVNPAFVRANEVRVLVGNAMKLEACIGTLPSISLQQTLEWMLNDVDVSAVSLDQVKSTQQQLVEAAA